MYLWITITIWVVVQLVDINGMVKSCVLTHWGRVTHICVSDVTIIGSDNGFSPGRHQAIILTNAKLLLNGSLGTHFSEILIEILSFSFKKMCLKVSPAKWRSCCLSLNVLTSIPVWHADSSSILQITPTPLRTRLWGEWGILQGHVFN